MKKIIGLLTAFLLTLSVFAQKQIPVSVTINSNCKGYYETLPAGYDSTKLWPLIIDFPGQGEHGTNLSAVLKNGVSKRLKDGLQLPCIVITPQFSLASREATPDEVSQLVNYVIAHYPVDQNRMYLTGLSYGAGELLGYLYKHADGKKIAAAVIMTPAYKSSNQVGPILVNNNVKTWFFVNSGDNVLGSGYVKNFGTQMLSAGGNATMGFKSTIFPAFGHDCWTKATDPNYKESGLNIYDWMFQFSKQNTDSRQIQKIVGSAIVNGKPVVLYDNHTWQ